MITDQLETLLQLGLKKVNSELAVSYSLEPTKNLKFGDYSSNIALNAVNNYNKNPRIQAENIINAINPEKPNYLAKIDIAGPGFINFHLSENFLLQELLRMATGDLASQNKQVLKNQKYLVEFSSPNIAKPFSIGHFRNTIIGAATANLLEYNGARVYRDNHLGDWGTQFGKQIYAIKTWGDEAKILKSDNPIIELVKHYVKFHQEADQDPDLNDQGREWFKKLEQKDPEALRLWQLCVQTSLRAFKRLYQRLGIEFSENNGQGYGESFFQDKMEPVIAELEKKKHLRESEGAKLVFFPQEKYPPLMIIKKDGTSLYSTRDLAADKFRFDTYGPNLKIINVVGSEQELYFKQLYQLEEMMGWTVSGQRIHLKHGMYRFQDRKMSTRKGDVILLEEVLDEAVKRARGLILEGEHSKRLTSDEIEDLASKVGLGALIWNDLKRRPSLDISFDWDEVLNMQGNSGPYVQYTYARTRSLLTKAANFSAESLKQEDLAAIILNNEEKIIARLLHRFSLTAKDSALEFSPQHLSNFIFQICQHFNAYYAKYSILEPETSNNKLARKTRLLMTMAVSNTIKQGLALLGIQAPEKM